MRCGRCREEQGDKRCDAAETNDWHAGIMPTVLFEQYVEEGLGCASYLIGDEHAGEAVVDDPAYAVDQYFETAERKGVRITRVLETHTHADHVSGHGRFALEHAVRSPFTPSPSLNTRSSRSRDGGGDRGGAGHAPRHPHAGPPPRALLLRRRRPLAAPEPWLVLTGDSLLVGDAARPDLAVEATEGAEGLFHSLRRLLELQDRVELYPGHVAGSLCGGAG